MAQNEMESLKGVLLGLGLQNLPKLIMSLHKARAMGKNLDEGRAPDDHGAGQSAAKSNGGGDQSGGADSLQSALLPLVAQLMGQGGAAGAGLGGPPAGPGLSPGLRAPALPAMHAMPRTQMASTGPGGL
jgi:hypothetical protein